MLINHENFDYCMTIVTELCNKTHFTNSIFFNITYHQICKRKSFKKLKQQKQCKLYYFRYLDVLLCDHPSLYQTPDEHYSAASKSIVTGSSSDTGMDGAVCVSYCHGHATILLLLLSVSLGYNSSALCTTVIHTTFSVVLCSLYTVLRRLCWTVLPHTAYEIIFNISDLKCLLSIFVPCSFHLDLK